jgi:hypothetical protein
MGVLTDFFIANDAELNAACHGWKRPAPLLDEFRTFTAINPFTQRPMEIRTRANPDQPGADLDAVTHCDFRNLPWIAQKGIMDTEVALLTSALLAWDQEKADEEIRGRILIGPPCEEVVFEIHPALLKRLAELSADECVRYGAEWCKRHREDAMTIPSESARERALARPETEWTSRLTEIASLAKSAIRDGRSMFMWIST